MKKHLLLVLSVTLIALQVSFPARAVDYVWNGGDGLWKSTNWDPVTGASGPVLTTMGDTATINSGTVSWNGTDFGIQAHDTLTINAGATWIQNTGTNYINFGNASGATLNVAGGTFDTNTSTGFFTGSSVANATTINISAAGTLKIGAGLTLGTGSSISLSGGSTATLSKGITIAAGATFALADSAATVGALGTPVAFSTTATSHLSLTGNSSLVAYNNTTVILPADFSLSSGATLDLRGTGEVQPGGGTSGITMTMSGGTLSTAGLLAFQGNNTQILDFSGGSITIGGATWEGIYSNGGYLNFTPGSTGTLLFTNIANAEQNIFQNQIRYDGATYTVGNYTDVFTVTHPTATQTQITLVSVPEPSALASLALGGICLMAWRRLTGRRYKALISGAAR
jgi:hypothetical protein